MLTSPKDKCIVCDTEFTPSTDNRGNPIKHLCSRNCYIRVYRLRTRYGLTLDEYKQMLARQDNACALCKRKDHEFLRWLHVDHDHRTGRIRGLLCATCNGRLGWMEVHEERIRAYRGY